jgi:hypothetical protein
MPGFATAMAVALLVGLPLYGIRRGSAQMFCVGIVLVIGALLAHALALALSELVPLGGRPGTDTSFGMWRLVFLVAVFLAAFPLGGYLSRYLTFTFDPFDFLAALCIGLFAAGVFAQHMLGALVMTTDGTHAHALMADSFLIRQLVYGDGWHSFFAWITNLRDVAPGSDLPHVDGSMAP